jgi:hypothetical protein
VLRIRTVGVGGRELESPGYPILPARWESETASKRSTENAFLVLSWRFSRVRSSHQRALGISSPRKDNRNTSHVPSRPEFLGRREWNFFALQRHEVSRECYRDVLMAEVDRFHGC